MTPLQKHLKSLEACTEARRWAGDRTAAETWAECERPDWMLWWAAKAGTDKRLVVRVACMCARLALKYLPKGEDRPPRAIEATERWCEDPSAENLAAVNKARFAYAAAAAAAAYAYDAAGYAAAAAAGAADAAAYAYDAADAAIRKECIEIIRREIPLPWSEER